MPKSSVACPSCFTHLKRPEGLPPGSVLKCPRCAHRFRLSVAPHPAAGTPTSEFWETAAINEALNAPAPPAEAPTAPVTPPIAIPMVPPGPALRPRSSVPVGLLVGTGGLCLGLGAVAAEIGRAHV